MIEDSDKSGQVDAAKENHDPKMLGGKLHKLGKLDSTRLDSNRPRILELISNYRMSG